MSKLRVISLFAGIGGFDLALARTGGFHTVAVAEVDPYASRVLSLRFPDAVNVGDVTTAEYPDADVICAGFPCQDISFAGAGAGLAGARSGLWREVVRAVSVVRPRVFILENVAALLSRGLDAVLWALAEVGYDAEWHCIPASAVGAPHRRDRIWIIAHPRGEQHEGDRAPISGALAAELSRANAEGERWDGCWLGAGDEGRDADAPGFIGFRHESAGDGPSDGTGPLAHADRLIRHGCGSARHGRDELANGSQDLADAACGGQQGARHVEGESRQAGQPFGAAWWAVEPDVGRVAHGIPKRVDRLRCLGNAVVPQIPELIGRAILASIAANPRDNTPQDHSDGLTAMGSNLVYHANGVA